MLFTERGIKQRPILALNGVFPLLINWRVMRARELMNRSNAAIRQPSQLACCSFCTQLTLVNCFETFFLISLTQLLNMLNFDMGQRGFVIKNLIRRCKNHIQKASKWLVDVNRSLNHGCQHELPTCCGLFTLRFPAIKFLPLYISVFCEKMPGTNYFFFFWTTSFVPQN